jgi:hypothetical protein
MSIKEYIVCDVCGKPMYEHDENVIEPALDLWAAMDKAVEVATGQQWGNWIYRGEEVCDICSVRCGKAAAPTKKDYLIFLFHYYNPRIGG